MYADLFDQLGRSRNPAANATAESPPIVAFKAGLMNLQAQTQAGADQNSFSCLADSSIRGQVRLIRNSSNSPSNNATDTEELKWQFFDRRRDSMVFEEIIPPGTTFTKVQPVQRSTSNKSSSSSTKDRIYVWTRPASTPIYRMFWMQDADDSEDEEIIKTVNAALQSAKAPAPQNYPRTNRSTATSADPQVDTLSSILENLGMPAPATPLGAAVAAAATTNTTTTTTTGTTNQLTLADLQGAMASIQAQLLQQQQQQPPPPDLADIVTSEAITELIQDDVVRDRLLQFLPENQQTPDHLRDNLLSPSVRRSLGLLSQALLAGGDSYGSVIANFQLDPVAGQDQLVQGNPIGAFLDCITASVQQEQEQQQQQSHPGQVNKVDDEDMNQGQGERATTDDAMKEEEEKTDDAAERQS